MDRFRTRSVSNVPSIKKHSRRPTEELIEQKEDEGYSSMPTLDQKDLDALPSILLTGASDQFDRMAAIDDDEEELMDVDIKNAFEQKLPKDNGLIKWKHLETAVTKVGTQLDVKPLATISHHETISEEEEDDDVVVDLQKKSLKPNINTTSSFRQKFISKFISTSSSDYAYKPASTDMDDEEVEIKCTRSRTSSNASSLASQKSKSKFLNYSFSFYKKGSIAPKEVKQATTSENTFYDMSLDEEYTLISEDSPDYNSDSEDTIAVINQKLFNSKYQELEKQIGTGGHSSVRLAELRSEPGKLVVCKYMQHTSVWNWIDDPATGRKIPLEINLMKKFSNPKSRFYVDGVIKFLDFFEFGGSFVIAMEYLGEDWVDLYDYIELFGPVEEDISKTIFSKIVKIITRMHSLGYCHNDIKDENILINKHTLEIKLIDFGSTTQLRTPEKLSTLFYGTKKFACPEAVSGAPYSPSKQEVWCLGTLLYVLIFKMDPFKDDKEIVDLNISGRIERLRKAGRDGGGAECSDNAAYALKLMMEKDCDERILLGDIPNLDFFKN